MWFWNSFLSHLEKFWQLRKLYEVPKNFSYFFVPRNLKFCNPKPKMFCVSFIWFEVLTLTANLEVVENKILKSRAQSANLGMMHWRKKSLIFFLFSKDESKVVIYAKLFLCGIFRFLSKNTLRKVCCSLFIPFSLSSVCVTVQARLFIFKSDQL